MSMKMKENTIMKNQEETRKLNAKKRKIDKKDEEEEEEKDEDILMEEDKIKQNLKMQNDGEDDDGVVEVSKKSAFEKMVKNKNEILYQLRIEEERLKMNRRKLDELYKKQKQIKLANLQDCKLSDDVLMEVGQTLERGENEVKRKLKIKDLKNKRDDADVDNEEEEDNDDINKDDDETDDDDDDGSNSEKEFIPLAGNKNDSHVQAFETSRYKPVMTSYDKAKEFKQCHLFGNRVKRQTIGNYLSSLEKRKALRM